jgi:hypothetical protein
MPYYSRDIIAPMNYRRGLQRVYLVCSVLWVVVIMVLAVRDSPRTVDYDALAKKYGAIDAPSNTAPTEKNWVAVSESKCYCDLFIDDSSWSWLTR